MTNGLNVLKYMQKIGVSNGDLKNCDSNKIATARVFTIFDKNKDGVVSKEEFDSVNNESYQKQSKGEEKYLEKKKVSVDSTIMPQYDDLKNIFAKTKQVDFLTYNNNLNKTLEFIKDYDKNNDKNISFNEHIKNNQDSINEMDSNINSFNNIISTFEDLKKQMPKEEFDKRIKKDKEHIQECNNFKAELEQEKKSLVLKESIYHLQYGLDSNMHDKEGNLIEFKFGEILSSAF